MINEKVKNLFLVLIAILVVISIPYLLYKLGTLIEIDYFGYINNWWIVLLFIVLLISYYILRGINFEKKMGVFFLTIFTVPFFILGMRFGVNATYDVATYALLLEKEQEINQLDSALLKLEEDFVQLEEELIEGSAAQGSDHNNHEIIFFTPGDYDLSEYNQNRVKAFVSNLEPCKLNINGYSDNSGMSSANMDISSERAENVAEFIKSINQEGISINKVSSFGGKHQLVENNSEMSRSKNRRVSIEIVAGIDPETKALRKKMLDELNANRKALKNVKVERDSLRKVMYPNNEG